MHARNKTKELKAEYEKETEIVKKIIENFPSLRSDSDDDNLDYDHEFSDKFHLAFKIDRNHLILPLHSAVKENEINTVRELVASGHDVNQLDGKKDKSGYSPLMWACRLGYYEIAEILVEAGANVNFRENNGAENFWRTPLSESINCGENMDITALLVKYGADIIDAEKGIGSKFIEGAKDIETAKSLYKLGFTTDNSEIKKLLTESTSTNALIAMSQRGATVVTANTVLPQIQSDIANLPPDLSSYRS